MKRFINYLLHVKHRTALKWLHLIGYLKYMFDNTGESAV